jgi:hypothetical protein
MMGAHARAGNSEDPLQPETWKGMEEVITTM